MSMYCFAYLVTSPHVNVGAQGATMLAVEQGQRWRCRTYSPRSTIIVPYSSTESVNSLPLKEGHDKATLLYFR